MLGRGALWRLYCLWSLYDTCRFLSSIVMYSLLSSFIWVRYMITSLFLYYARFLLYIMALFFIQIFLYITFFIIIGIPKRLVWVIVLYNLHIFYFLFICILLCDYFVIDTSIGGEDYFFYYISISFLFWLLF